LQGLWRKRLRIIGLVGMPGSGKSVASEVARGMGLEVIVMGDVIRKEAASLDLEPTDENLGMVGNMLRSTDGSAAIAKRTIDLARRSKRDLVIIDGLRSAEEADFFERNSEDFMLVEIFASSKARVRRIASRGRSDDARPESKTCQDAERPGCSGESLDVAALALERRESREMSWGMLKAIRAADLRIRNDGDLDDFRTKVELLFRDIESKCI
jgi:dephospho-CoA kinase